MSRMQTLRLIAAIGVAAGFMTISPAALARTAANPSIRVQFSMTGTIAVTGPGGAPLGTASGAPTVIPAGYYTLLLLGPGGCANIPYFELHGPGENVANNLTEGELDNDTVNLYLQPNSTYTWRNRDVPGSVFTFATSADVQGTAPAVAPPGGLTGKGHTTIKSSDLAGSGVLPFRGTIAAEVSPSGRLSFAYKGKPVTSLKAGKYTVAVVDRSAKTGVALRKVKRTFTVTTKAFVGKRAKSVQLTTGRWVVTPGATAITVS